MKEIFIEPGHTIETDLDESIILAILDKGKGTSCIQKISKSFLKLSSVDQDEALKSMIVKMKNSGSARASLMVYLCRSEKVSFDPSLVQVFENLKIPVTEKKISCRESELLKIKFSDGQIYVRKIPVISKPKVDSLINVLIVEDSAPMQKILRHCFSSSKNVANIDVVDNLRSAREKMSKQMYDLISLDLILPDGNGVQLLNSNHTKSKFLLITDCSPEQGGLVFEALQSGVYDYIRKPSREEYEEFELKIQEIIQSIEEKMDIKKDQPIPIDRKFNKKRMIRKCDFILIGSSTGGTEVLRRIFSNIKINLAPIFIVQHMPQHFTSMFAKILTNLSGRQVHEVLEPMKVVNGHVYLAAGGTQMMVYHHGNDEVWVKPTDDAPVNRFKPSVDYLFQSILKLKQKQSYRTGIGIIMTGMGNDGAEGLKGLRSKGFHTITQSEESCLVYGMPRVAYESGASIEQLSPDEIVKTLNQSLSIFEKKR